MHLWGWEGKKKNNCAKFAQSFPWLRVVSQPDNAIEVRAGLGISSFSSLFHHSKKTSSVWHGHAAHKASFFPLSKENISSTYCNNLTSPSKVFFCNIAVNKSRCCWSYWTSGYEHKINRWAWSSKVKDESKYAVWLNTASLWLACIPMVRPMSCCFGLLHQHIPMRWALRHCLSLPLQQGLQAALATLPKNKRWGKEAESDSPKAKAGCKTQRKYPRNFKIWMCVHSQPDWTGVGMVLQAELGRRRFLCGGLQGGKRGTGNSDPF